MKIRPLIIKDTSALQPGELFYHQSSGALCVAARWAQDPQQLRIVPINYPQSPQSNRVAIYEDHFRSTAVIIENAIAEVDAKSFCYNQQASIFGSGGGLFLPLTNGRGFISGFLNLSSGEIVDHVRDGAGFAAWRIVDDEDSDKVIWETEAAGHE